MGLDKEIEELRKDIMNKKNELQNFIENGHEEIEDIKALLRATIKSRKDI